MQYHIIPVTHYQQNCSLVWCEETSKAALIDPGGDCDVLLAAIEERGLTLEKCLLTHGHLDHVGGALQIAKQTGATIVGPHQEDMFWLQALPQQAEMFGFPPTDAINPDQWLDEGSTVSIGNQSLEVLHCPGHTPGHIVFYNTHHKIAFVGDVLFQNSIGRTDFPKGDYTTLMESICNKLLPLGDDIEFVPGHGPCSTLGKERAHNPFIAEFLQ